MTRCCYSCGFESKDVLLVSPPEWERSLALCRECAQKPRVVSRLMSELTSVYLTQIMRFADQTAAPDAKESEKKE